MTPDLEKELRARAEAATTRHLWKAIDGPVVIANDTYLIADLHDALGDNEANAAYIALACPANILILLDALRDANAREAELKKAIAKSCFEARDDFISCERAATAEAANTALRARVAELEAAIEDAQDMVREFGSDTGCLEASSWLRRAAALLSTQDTGGA